MVTVLAQGSDGYYKMGDDKYKSALYWHDTVNVYALPVLGAACTLSLLGILDGLIVSPFRTFRLQLVADKTVENCCTIVRSIFHDLERSDDGSHGSCAVETCPCVFKCAQSILLLIS